MASSRGREQVVDVLRLVELAAIFHELLRLVARKLEGLELEVLLHDLLHLGLDLGEVLVGETAIAVHVVVESVGDGGADGQFGLRVEPFHGLCKNMGRSVPQYRETVFHFLYSSVVK